GVEVQRGGRPFVSHDALDHVHGDTIVDEPGGVGMPKIMKTWPGSAGLGDVQDGFTFGHQFLGECCSVALGPAATDGVVVDDGEGSEHSRSYQRWAPDPGAEQGATQWFADGVGEDGCFGRDWVSVQVLADDWHQPAWYRHGASASAAFWVRLDRRVPAD